MTSLCIDSCQLSISLSVWILSSYVFLFVKPLTSLTAYRKWDSQQKGLALQLEHVQGFAARLVTGRWKEDWQALCSELGWCTLVQRRKYERIRMCRRILQGCSIIPPICLQAWKQPSQFSYSYTSTSAPHTICTNLTISAIIFCPCNAPLELFTSRDCGAAV